ncbi:MAG: S-formylglutathione hydrolase [Paracoccaceae bacterium]|nr:S-formylglutathione hydrolase [Paracoccaceae bacterium]
MALEAISENVCFGGVQGVYTHGSSACSCPMTFGLYLPPAANTGQKVPVIWYLSGLTCTHENAMIKAGAQGWAARHGVAVVFPDTSPRGENVADDPEYDLGQGAGFYVNATEAPWAPHYRMWDYVTEELPELLFHEFPLDPEAQGITGHSMGGHGAMTIAMTRTGTYRSLSALAPIANPTESDMGRRQFAAYLGSDRALWRAHDSTLLMCESPFPGPILVDQGDADPFIENLRPEALAKAVAVSGQDARIRRHPRYDHSYFFVASFMEDHIRHHADILHGR